MTPDQTSAQRFPTLDGLFRCALGHDGCAQREGGECQDRPGQEPCPKGLDECSHFACPDGWHYALDLPCACTRDCELPDAGSE